MCGNLGGWPTARGLWMCRSCNRQTSITAGTIFHRSRLPLKTWFSAIWFVCAQKTGVSALGLQQMLGFGSYETAWAWLHKLRRAMVRPDRELLGGPGVTVELDSTFIGGRQGGRVRNQYLNKQEVAIAVEHRQPSGFGRARLALIDSQDRKKGLFTFARTCIAPGTVLHTDGDQLFKDLPQRMPISHQRTVLQGVEATAHEALPGVHRVASLLKRWLAGTLHNGHSSAHLSYYLDEFTFRFNRRPSRSRGLLFYRLLQQAAHTDPHPLASLVAPPVTDRDDWS
jgi:ISXO2-like transposase domain